MDLEFILVLAKQNTWLKILLPTFLHWTSVGMSWNSIKIQNSLIKT